MLQLAASVLHTGYCVPSFAHPPVASSSCIPLTIPTQLSIQSIMDAKGARHMAYVSTQELPLQSYLECMLNCGDHERHDRAKRGTTCGTRAQLDSSHGHMMG